MLHELVNIDDALERPGTPLHLAARMRELRTRQGLKQSEVARRMGLDPSIPSLWEQGKRPVPSNRVPALADALGVSVAELLDGAAASTYIEGPPRHAERSSGQSFAGFSTRERTFPDRSGREEGAGYDVTPGRLAPLAAPTNTADSAPVVVEPPRPRPPFVPAPRPPLVGWIPQGWEPGERIQDIAPVLPDGYWLDPVRLEKPSAKHLLRLRLCPSDLALTGDREIPGTALAQRIYAHCGREEGFVSAGKLPLVEAIFRAVLTAERGGLSVAELVAALSERGGAVPITAGLLRRLRDSVRVYPMRWVDRDLFD